jgi:hypothetical protein
MDGHFFKFPIYAIFIGANLGLASIALLQKVFDHFAVYWIVSCIVMLIISALLCIFSSDLLWQWPLGAYAGIGILIVAYCIALTLSLFIPQRIRFNQRLGDTFRRIAEETNSDG